MTAPGAKVGPLTQADLQAIWEGTADSSFVQPLEAAGEGAGLEAYTQLFAQMARASLAADVTTQALYILPNSGQSNPPAGGAAEAAVLLTVSRDPASGYASWPLVIAQGQVLFDEQTTDWGDAGSVVVLTGRRYVAAQTLVFPPGDTGPYTIQAAAELPGYGYSNPLPGTIAVVDQPGNQYSHDRASMVVSPPGAPVAPGGASARATLVAVNEPDMFLPTHVGQYVLMTSGANAGMVGRIVAFVQPNPPLAGTGAVLAYDQAVECTGAAGAFFAGEPVQFKSGGSVVAVGVFLGSAPSPTGSLRVVYTLQTGAVAAGDTVLGVNSAATATVSTILRATAWTQAITPPNSSPGAGENWRILDWAVDLKVAVTNPASPQGGRGPMLDGLGDERGIVRTTNETDDAYRQRIAAPNDVVSPNAIRRAITRAIGNALWCFREVGSPALPGFYYDRAGDPNGDFYDTNALLFTGNGPFPVAAIRVLTVGTGYFAGTAGVSFIPSTGGPSATAVLASGAVVAVNVVTGGSYTAAPSVIITSVAGLGSGATVQALLGAPFLQGETIQWRDSGGIPVAQGIFGGYLPSASGSTLVMVLRPLHGSTRPTLAIQAGDVIVGLTSGLTFTPAGVSQPASTNSMRFRIYLDYASFRAYFLVGVANLTDGEFGFAYDGPAGALVHVGGFYDATGPHAIPGYFYDGFPRVARQRWLNVIGQVDRVRAGGVGWDMYREQIGCP